VGVWYGGIMCDRASVAMDMGFWNISTGLGVGRSRALMHSGLVKVLP